MATLTSVLESLAPMRVDFDVSFTDTPPAASDLALAVQRVGLTVVPPDWEAWLSVVDALWVDAHVDWWPDGRGGGPAFIFYRGLYTFGVGSGLPPMLGLVETTREFRASTGTTLVPCLRVTNDADCYCFTAEGQLVHWSHDSDQTRVDGGFFDLLERELAELDGRARKARAFFGETK